MRSQAKSMSGVEARDLKDRAHQLMRKGKLEAAADVYLQLIAQNDKDPALRLHHAELCDKLNRKDRAISSYLVAAHLLLDLGHTARARAALSAGLRISPGDSSLKKALLEVAPPPKLELVRQPIAYVDFELVPDDEVPTEPNTIPIDAVFLGDECEAAPIPQTISQRTPARARSR